MRETMTAIHVCLVSDQTIPNILAIEAFNPDGLLMISTVKMEAKGKSCHILECLAARGLDFSNRHHVLTVSEDSITDCHRKLEEWIQGQKNADYLVNLTCGTKIMSIAAYAFFKDYGSRMIYVPIPRNEYIMPFPKGGLQHPTKLAQRLSVMDYLKAYGLTTINSSKLEGMAQAACCRRELSRWVIANYVKLKSHLGKLGNKLRPHRGDREYKFKETFLDATDEDRELMHRMGFSVNGSLFEKHLSKSETQFLTGGWLEEYCFNEVSSFIGHGIDDAVIGIQIKNPKGTDNEFDIMLTKDNALYTIECKSLDQLEDSKTEALYKVGALQKDFGLRVRSFFVSTSSNVLNNKGEIKPAIAARAEHLNTDVIPPYEVINFKKRLAEMLKLNG